MGYRCHIRDRAHFHAHRLYSPYSRFAARARPFDDQVDFLNTHRHRLFHCLLGSQARRKRRALA